MSRARTAPIHPMEHTGRHTRREGTTKGDAMPRRIHTANDIRQIANRLGQAEAQGPRALAKALRHEPIWAGTAWRLIRDARVDPRDIAELVSLTDTYTANRTLRAWADALAPDYSGMPRPGSFRDRMLDLNTPRDVNRALATMRDQPGAWRNLPAWAGEAAMLNHAGWTPDELQHVLDSWGPRGIHQWHIQHLDAASRGQTSPKVPFDEARAWNAQRRRVDPLGIVQNLLGRGPAANPRPQGMPPSPGTPPPAVAAVPPVPAPPAGPEDDFDDTIIPPSEPLPAATGPMAVDWSRVDPTVIALAADRFAATHPELSYETLMGATPRDMGAQERYQATMLAAINRDVPGAGLRGEFDRLLHDRYGQPQTNSYTPQQARAYIEAVNRIFRNEPPLDLPEQARSHQYLPPEQVTDRRNLVPMSAAAIWGGSTVAAAATMPPRPQAAPAARTQTPPTPPTASQTPVPSRTPRTAAPPRPAAGATQKRPWPAPGNPDFQRAVDEFTAMHPEMSTENLMELEHAVDLTGIDPNDEQAIHEILFRDAITDPDFATQRAEFDRFLNAHMGQPTAQTAPAPEARRPVITVTPGGGGAVPMPPMPTFTATTPAPAPARPVASRTPPPAPRQAQAPAPRQVPMVEVAPGVRVAADRVSRQPVPAPAMPRQAARTGTPAPAAGPADIQPAPTMPTMAPQPTADVIGM